MQAEKFSDENGKESCSGSTGRGYVWKHLVINQTNQMVSCSLYVCLGDGFTLSSPHYRLRSPLLQVSIC